MKRAPKPETVLQAAIVAALSFTIDGPPVPKARARVVNGHAFTPARTEAYERLVALVATAARQRAKAWPLDGRYAVEIDVYRQHRRGDLDNFAKAILDGCNGVLWTDDARVCDLHVRIHDGDSKPRAAVRVEVTEARDAIARARRGEVA